MDEESQRCVNLLTRKLYKSLSGVLCVFIIVYLHRIDWVMGYFSSGESIEVGVFCVLGVFLFYLHRVNSVMGY